MRTLIALWLAPLAVFWSWYWLSLYDLGLGSMLFSPALHAEVFALYGSWLGIDPDALPGLLAKACLTDALLAAALVAFRFRRVLSSLLVGWRRRHPAGRPLRSS
jgi:hypothetical protein